MSNMGTNTGNRPIGEDFPMEEYPVMDQDDAVAIIDNDETEDIRDRTPIQDDPGR